VADTILGYILLLIGTLFLVYSVFGRFLKFHRPIGWVHGGHMNLCAELAVSIFVLCIGLCVLHSPVWIIFVLPAWVVGFFSQIRTNRQYHLAEDKLRTKNAQKYPGVFDTEPPYDVNSFPDKEFDLYDADTCTYLGKILRQDVKVLIDRFTEIPEQTPNDIYMLVESMEILPKESMSQDLIKLLENAFEKRDCLVLRWLPASLSKMKSENTIS